MSRRNNRSMGLAVERSIINILANAFGLKTYNPRESSRFQIASSRALSKVRDDEGVDIIFSKDTPDVLRRWSIQVKRSETSSDTNTPISLNGLLRIIDEDHPLLITRVMRKRNVKATTVGDFVTMKLDDFIELLKEIEH